MKDSETRKYYDAFIEWACKQGLDEQAQTSLRNQMCVRCPNRGDTVVLLGGYVARLCPSCRNEWQEDVLRTPIIQDRTERMEILLLLPEVRLTAMQEYRELSAEFYRLAKTFCEEERQ